MPPHVYFDVLDTSRTFPGDTSETVRSANECILFGAAEVKMAVLRGWIPVFPQTYGWDSTALLSYAAEPGTEGACFRWLLEQGLVQIRLRDAPSVWDAALSGFENPIYHRLTSWPEFNTSDPLEARRPLVEAMRTRKYPNALPESARERLHVLRQLSDAASKNNALPREQPRGDRLRQYIASSARIAERIDPTLANLLSRCTEIPTPNVRTSIDEFLDSQATSAGSPSHVARDITNCCFNAVAAECLSASIAGLTTPHSEHPNAIRVIADVMPGSYPTDLFHRRADSVVPAELADLQVVGWEHVRDFVRDKGGLSLDERQKEAEAAKLIAEVAIENRRRYGLVVQARTVLSIAALAGAALVVGGVGGGLATAGVILFAGLGGLDFGSAARGEMRRNLERKWRGLLRLR